MRRLDADRGPHFYCDKSANGFKVHGVIDLREAIAESCDVFFYTYGLRIKPAVIATEARRFHLDHPTGIDLPYEVQRMLIPTRTGNSGSEMRNGPRAIPPTWRSARGSSA